MFASACGRWLVTATSRSWAPASIATGRAPSEATNPCTARRSSGPVPAVGVRNQVAPSNRSAFARSGPRVSAPQIGCPPMKRPSLPAAAQTALFVEPTSVTAQAPEAASSTSRMTCGSSATGAATSTRSAPATASARVVAGSTASRSWATRSVSGSGSQPRTTAPARRAASAADVPIRPVPTTVTFRSMPCPTLASARRRGTPDRATGGRSGADRRAFRTGCRAAPRALPPSRRGIPSRSRR